MLRNLAGGILCAFALCCVAGICLAAHAAPGQNHPARTVHASVRVLMVSDIHFDPFWDPAKVVELAKPGSNWNAILSAAPSAERAQRYAALQERCHVKGADTSYALLESSLRAMRAYAAGAKFITVSGDLMAHGFDCKFRALLPHATPADYDSFVMRTILLVEEQLHVLSPGVAVYTALGNNDSDCGDYRLNPHGKFLTIAGPPVLAEDVPQSEPNEALHTFMAGGYYSVRLPAPMERTRLLVLDDVFMSAGYATCGGTPDPKPAEEQIAWLRRQLKRARRAHQKVWVMAHIPPGIDPYSTIRKMANVCAGAAPVTFLRSDALADTIAEFGDVVRLAIFAHTHMDELRLLRADKPGGHERPVAVKMVPSISPIHENEPAFVVASVDPDSAILKDYRVIAASNGTGVGTHWRQEYDFDRAYGERDFSGASVEKLIAGFRADPGAEAEASESYLRNYYVGDRSALLKLFWPEYTCTLADETAAGFRSCACGDTSGH